MEMDTQHPDTGFDLAAVDKLLTSTRSVRKRLDFGRPVPLEVVTECLRIALQAPTGSNAQRWRWVVVTDPEVRHGLADLYRPPAPEKRLEPKMPSTPQQDRMMDSAQYLLHHIHEVPVMVVPCIEDSGAPPDGRRRSIPRSGASCSPSVAGGSAR